MGTADSDLKTMAVVASAGALEFCLQSLLLAGVGGQVLFDIIF